MNNGLQALAKYGRNGDTELAHVTVGEIVLPPSIFAEDKNLQNKIEKKLSKLDTNLGERTVGSALVSYNPNTGLQEFFIKSLFKKVKKGVSSLWKRVKKVIDPVAKVARFIPGPWQPAANIYVKGKAALDIVKGEGGLGDLATLFTGSNVLGKGGDLATFADKGFQFGDYGSALRSGLGNFFGGSAEYTIQPGDTLSDIATKSGTTVDALAAANNITDPSKIFAGNTLTIPKSGNFLSNFFSGDPNYDPATGKGQSRLGMIEDFFKGDREGEGSFFGRKTPDFIKNIEDELKDSFNPAKGGIDPKLFAASMAYGQAIKKAAEKEAEGMKDIRQSLRPDLLQRPIFGGGGFNLGFAEGGKVYSDDEVLDMRLGGESAGPGTGTSDDIPAMLSDGEFVMTAKAVRGAGTVKVKKGKDGLLSFVKSGKPSRDKGSDNMMVMMKYFEGEA